MTSNGYFALKYVFVSVYLASDRAMFENNCAKTNKDGPHTVNGRNFFRNLGLVSGNIVYADIHRGSLERRYQTTVGSRVNAPADVAC